MVFLSTGGAIFKYLGVFLLGLGGRRCSSRLLGLGGLGCFGLLGLGLLGLLCLGLWGGCRGFLDLGLGLDFDLGLGFGFGFYFGFDGLGGWLWLGLGCMSGLGLAGSAQVNLPQYLGLLDFDLGLDFFNLVGLFLGCSLGCHGGRNLGFLLLPLAGEVLRLELLLHVGLELFHEQGVHVLVDTRVRAAGVDVDVLFVEKILDGL
jgi:hypothetical protein